MFTPQQVEKVNKTFNALKVWFDGFVEADMNHLEGLVSNARMLKAYQSVYTHPRLLHNHEYRMTVIASGLMVNGKDTDHELHWLAIRELSENFGHILIKPDYLKDKLAEFFDIAAINPERNPEFSVKYHFSSTEPARAFDFATSDRLHKIEKVDDLMIEINGNMLIARSMRELNPADCVSLVSLVSHL